MARNNTVLLIAGGLVAAGLVYALVLRTEEKALQVDVLSECGKYLTTFTGLMDIRVELSKFGNNMGCVRLVDQYVQNNQPIEYSKLVVAKKLTVEQAKMLLELDVDAVNKAMQALENA